VRRGADWRAGLQSAGAQARSRRAEAVAERDSAFAPDGELPVLA
jgi:hypothetical protein